MFRALIPALLALLAWPALADDVSKVAKAAELMDLMTDNGRMLTDAMSLPLPELPTLLPAEQQEIARRLAERMMEAYRKVMSWEKLRADIVAYYVEAFTEPQIDDLLAFYRSPTGRAMVAKQPEMTRKISEVMVGMIAAAQPELQKIMREYAEEMERSVRVPPPPKPTSTKP